MDATQLEPPESEYPLDEWYTAAEYAREFGQRSETVNTVLKCGFLPGWRKPSGRWVVPPEAVNEEAWGKALRKLRTNPEAVATFCATVFEMSAADKARLKQVLVARRPEDPMAEVVRWMMRGIAASRRGLTPSSKRRVFERDGGRCTYCRRKARRWEYDHVTPVSWGGDHADDNIVLACRECNRMKRDDIGLRCRTCDRLTFEVRGYGRNRCGCETRPFAHRT